MQNEYTNSYTTHSLALYTLDAFLVDYLLDRKLGTTIEVGSVL